MTRKVLSKTARNAKLWEIKRYYTMIIDERQTQQGRHELSDEEYWSVKDHLEDELERLRSLFTAVKRGSLD